MKAFHIVLAILLILLPISARAQHSFTDGDFTYEIVSVEERTCMLVGPANGSDNIVGDIEIPSIVQYRSRDVKVVKIAPKAFYRCKLRSVRIGPNVVEIGEQAFYECKDLIYVYIPDTCKQIGKDAFGPNPDGGKHEVIVKENKGQVLLRQTGKNIEVDDLLYSPIVIDGKPGLEVVGLTISYIVKKSGILEIPDAVEVFGSKFDVLSIGQRSFAGSGIVLLITGDSVIEIGNSAFEGCSALWLAVFGKGVKRIGDRAFIHCHSLTGVDFSDGIQSIGNWAFADTKLYERQKAIILPPSCTSLGDYAFYNESSGKDRILIVHASESYFDFPSQCDTTMYSVHVGDAFNSQAAFKTTFNKIGFADDVKKVPSSTTSSTQPISILSLGVNTENVGDLSGMPFSEPSLLIVRSPKPPRAEGFNETTYLLTTLLVPQASIELYKNAPVWKNFWVIDGIEDSVFLIDLFMDIEIDDTEYEIMDYKEAEEVVEEEVEEEERAFELLFVPPMFNGGDMNDFALWVGQHLEYPEIAKENGIDGKVTLQFTVEKDGRVTNVKVVRGVDPVLDKEAVRVVRSSPKWTPGKQRDRAIKWTYTFQVIFQLK